MKNKIQSILLVGLLAIPCIANAQKNIKSHPAYLPIDEALDLSMLQPEVNVNLPKFLLSEAAAGFDSDPAIGLKEAGINLKELVKDIQLIRVLVMESNKNNAAKLNAGIKQLRDQLNTKWIPLVMVPGDGIGVYAMSNEAGDKMEGIAAIVGEEGDGAVIINVVGNVPIAKIINLTWSNDKLPKDLLRNLGGIAMRQSIQEAELEALAAEAAAKEAAASSENETVN